MPQVWEDAPDLRLHVVGSNVPEVVKSLASARVVVHGYLTDEELAQRYAAVRAVVVPLRYGAGVKGKVLDALRHGLPVVTTSIGVEGLPEPELVLQVEDTVEGFARALLAVERGEAWVAEKRSRCADYLHRHFSKARAREILIQDFGDPKISRNFD